MLELLTISILCSSCTGNHGCYVFPAIPRRQCLSLGLPELLLLQSVYPLLPGWPPSLGRRGTTQVSCVRLSTESTCPVLTSHSSSLPPFPERPLKFIPWRMRIPFALGRECNPPQIDLAEKLNTSALLEGHTAASLPSYYRPQRTLPSQNVDLIHRQRK